MRSAEDIELICNTLESNIHDTRSELNYLNEYTFLIAVLLSAQTTDKRVNIVTKRLFEEARTPLEMVSLGYEHICDLIKSVGLYKTKAKNVLLLSQKLIDEFEGVIPNTLLGLVSLPGVGVKTANVVLNQIFGQPTIAVDTHVFRVSRRLMLSSGKTPKDVLSDLELSIPCKHKIHIGDRLLLHGRYTCTAKNPRCDTCCLAQLCHFKRQQ